MKKLKQKLWLTKSFFTILFSSLFIILSKVKVTPIIGTSSKFSAVAIFGPILGRVLGIPLGVGTIALSHVIGLLIGFYKIKSLRHVFTFVPLMGASIYFAKIFKGSKKLTILPSLAILLFILHPIGRQVWFYSLFWTIPIFVAIFKKRIDYFLKRRVAYLYLYSLGTTFVDHAIGSIIFLYSLNIPTTAWIAAIPFTVIERIIMAGGIEFTYLFVEKSLKVLKEIPLSIALMVVQKTKEKVKVEV